MAKYILPDLRYDYSALEPHVSGRIMELHHDKHHAGYVKAANDTLDQLDEARLKADFTRLAAMERALAFNLSDTSCTRSSGKTSLPTVTNGLKDCLPNP